MKKYPHIGDKYKAQTHSGKCFICSLPKSDYRIEVQISYMRGDDEIVKAHHKCIKELKDNQLLQEILEYWKNENPT